MVFFFQAEDGIRDGTVTGVQTCALPISAAGAAIGGRSGAAVGAGGGLLVGSAAGADAADRSAYGVQRRYDYAFIQCMYAKGHKVPVSGRLTSAPPAGPAYAPPPPPPPPR